MKEIMEKSAPEYLTADELRNRLFHSLRNRGMVNSIKSQLRNSLVTELQQSLKGRLSLRDLKIPDEDSLLHRAANSLVVDHLRSYGYDYTASVFLPESGLAHDKVFKRDDFLQLLHVSPQSKLHQQLVRCDEKEGKGFLWSFLTEMSAIHANSTQEFGVQTDLIKVGPISSLDEKLHVLDELYSSKRDDVFKSSAMLTEERILNFQKQVEERYQAQLKQEIRRFRENELSKLKLEERENSRREMDQLRRDLERDYHTKYDALSVRERNTTERLHREQEIRDKEMHSTRQTLQEEINCIHQREADVKREAEINNREKKLNEDRIKARESELRFREAEVKRKEIEFDQRLENEMAKFKLDQQAKFINRTQNVEVREAKVKEIERVISEEKDKLQSYKDDIRDKTNRINELETFLQEARHKEVSANRNNEFLNSKLRDMCDYSTLKEQVVAQRHELETLRTRLSEVLNMNERERGRQEELLREMRRPTPETLMMQRDMERARENLRQEQVVFEQQKQLLEKRLKDEIDRNRDLVTRYEEQTLQMKEMNREVVDLRQHLSVTNIALNNEVYRRPHSEADGRTSLHNSQRSEKRVDFQTEAADPVLRTSGHQASLRTSTTRPRYETRDVYNDVDFDLDLGALPTGQYDPLEEDLSSATSNSADVVADAKYRLKTLEREAKNLEKAYQNFHYNITNPSSIPDPTFSTNQREAEPSRSRSTASHASHVISPAQSPIPHSRPLSSTPHYHHTKTQQQQYSDDSFEELSRGSKEKVKTTDPLLKFNLSAMSEDDHKRNVVEKRDKSRPITIDDLEARPGSPSLVVVAGSESPSEHSRDKDATDRLQKQTPAFLPPISLDDAWKTTNQKTDGDQELERQREELEKERWEEERREREEERKKVEREEWEREQRELAKLEGKVTSDDEKEENAGIEEKKEEEIDPIMQQYMAMVQQNRQKDTDTQKEVKSPAKVTKSGQDKSPIPTDEEISIAEDLKSDNNSDDGFSW
ncbi:hypothetical protein SNE40_016198 [Patella caerulea]|uniref:LisH domain-containing protein n=2 Tax=Patella caerulea TaxID=87958 RepID=A0AAN8JCP4_PATCE